MSASRPLASSERVLLHGFSDTLDLGRVRIYHSRSLLGRMIIGLSRGAAITLGYRIVVPREVSLPVMAHELAHVSQYQEWGAWRYLARGAWHQVVLRGLLGRDVYRWEAEPGKVFADYDMEQQAQIVQDCFDLRSPRRADALRLSPFAPG
jgi:hypothetical protein